MTDFSQLLKDAEKLTSGLEGPTRLPTIKRSLKQVVEESKDLYTRLTQSGTKDIQANLLLSSRGIDLPKITQKLESFSTKCTFEPVKPVEDVDIHNILENEIRNKTLAAFDSSYNEMLESTSQSSWEHQEAEWKREKRKILSAMTASSGMLYEVKQPNLIVKQPTPFVANLGSNETIYVAKIMEYNQMVNSGIEKPNLVNVFNEISEEFKDSRITDMWEIIKYVTQVPVGPPSYDPIKQRYSDTFINSLVNQAKRYLEDRYRTYMTHIINENLARAFRGGTPGTYNLVRSFVGLRLQGEYLGLQDGIVEDRPLWPMVYYCLRAGDLTTAIECLQKSDLTGYKDIITILQAKLNNCERSEILKLEDGIRSSYRRMVRNDTDPFKRIVFSILGCCDVVDDHSEVARTADDYLWLKLSLVRTDKDRDDCIKYPDLQYVISAEYGESYYDAFNRPHVYFQVLALTGQFEVAFEFLSRIDKFKVHAVHMAIALNELYMLGIPNEYNSPLICVDPQDPKPVKRLNVARLIMMYVQKFEMTSIPEALNYFYLLKNFTDGNGHNLFESCVSNLAIETKKYETIFGRIGCDGIRTKGLIDNFIGEQITAESTAQMTAETLIQKGLYEEAIDMYDIANKQEEVLKLLCNLLSRVAHLEPKEESFRSHIQRRAILFADRFARDGYHATPNLVNSFLKLKDLLLFFDYYHNKMYPLALETIDQLQLIPLRPEDIDSRVKGFKNLIADICTVIPDVLLATMNILFAQYQKIRGNCDFIPRLRNESFETQLEILRRQAKCLTNFTGMLPYRTPGDTSSRLMQMEIMMH